MITESRDRAIFFVAANNVWAEGLTHTFELIQSDSIPYVTSVLKTPIKGSRPDLHITQTRLLLTC